MTTVGQGGPDALELLAASALVSDPGALDANRAGTMTKDQFGSASGAFFGVLGCLCAPLTVAVIVVAVVAARQKPVDGGLLAACLGVAVIVAALVASMASKVPWGKRVTVVEGVITGWKEREFASGGPNQVRRITQVDLDVVVGGQRYTLPRSINGFGADSEDETVEMRRRLSHHLLNRHIRLYVSTRSLVINVELAAEQPPSASPA